MQAQSRGTRSGPTGKLPAGHIETRLLRFSGDEHVAGPAHGLDRARPIGVLLDLASQPGDADVDRAVEGLPLAVAGEVEELVPREHLVRMLEEGLEKRELHRRD